MTNVHWGHDYMTKYTHNNAIMSRCPWATFFYHSAKIHCFPSDKNELIPLGKKTLLPWGTLTQCSNTSPISNSWTPLAQTGFRLNEKREKCKYCTICVAHGDSFIMYTINSWTIHYCYFWANIKENHLDIIYIVSTFLEVLCLAWKKELLGWNQIDDHITDKH